MTAPLHWSLRRKAGAAGLLVLAALLLVLSGLALVPPNINSLASHPNPAASYADAVQRVAALQAQEATGYNPRCETQLLTHGQKTARAIAFVHGYTNCPAQFLTLGQQFYALGYNVLLVPLPHHGLADLMTTDLSHLTAEELAAYSDQVVDISHGLGDRVTLAGLSEGGIVAAWAAQTRPDLDQAVLIAPGLGLKPVPPPVTILAVNGVLLAPDQYLWWDPAHQANSPPPTLRPQDVQGYPRFSLHGLAQGLRLSLATRSLARRVAPGAHTILVVTNGADQAVDNAVAEQVAVNWRAHGASVSTYQFPASLNLPHDLISPQQAQSRVDLVYPQLIALINT